ncbi:hypothetical protein T440DRAFT_523251 [Plenodomus tracheiphilus IPT5]|uniref:Uncharacterized protein n=1 Tax=Plenodomus tracheiphilus IPT5 TaxID=1408161 RepID=A0A6A7ARK1_9PLEO|nr:hypothetical protein T440DRAFT_523251 [Plenodomus tracheiphilus IPT5]
MGSSKTAQALCVFVGMISGGSVCSIELMVNSRTSNLKIKGLEADIKYLELQLVETQTLEEETLQATAKNLEHARSDARSYEERLRRTKEDYEQLRLTLATTIKDANEGAEDLKREVE